MHLPALSHVEAEAMLVNLRSQGQLQGELDPFAASDETIGVFGTDAGPDGYRRCPVNASGAARPH